MNESSLLTLKALGAFIEFYQSRTYVLVHEKNPSFIVALTKWEGGCLKPTAWLVATAGLLRSYLIKAIAFGTQATVSYPLESEDITHASKQSSSAEAVSQDHTFSGLISFPNICTIWPE